MGMDLEAAVAALRAYLRRTDAENFDQDLADAIGIVLGNVRDVSEKLRPFE